MRTTLSAVVSFFRSMGPAIIVASIVLGPGSILTSSKVGCQYGYQMVWVLVAAVALLMAMTALAAYLGALLPGSLCDELARRWGRPAAIAVGILMFVIIACFQSSNNAAILAALDGFRPAVAEVAPEAADVSPTTTKEAAQPSGPSVSIQLGTLAVLNGLLIAVLFGMRQLYRPLERLMMILVLGMMVGFGINLFVVRPDLSQTLAGLIPSLPQDNAGTSSTVLALLGLVATTFSVAGAFYQAYLVREKGWDASQVRSGLWDSILGIGTLGFVSLVIMLTSAAALHGKIAVTELKSVNDVARQLQPLFGSAASFLFTCGLFAAALSSFLGNALIGGTILSDSLGLGASIQGRWPRVFTVVALLTGMAVAGFTAIAGNNQVDVIVLAQALTVLGTPLLALILLLFGWQVRQQYPNRMPLTLVIGGGIGFAVSLVLAARMVLKLAGG